MDKAAQLLESYIGQSVEGYICEGEPGDCEWRVYRNGLPEIYDVDEPMGGGVVVERRSDGARFVVYHTVYVKELP